MIAHTHAFGVPVFRHCARRTRAGEKVCCCGVVASRRHQDDMAMDADSAADKDDDVEEVSRV